MAVKPKGLIVPEGYKWCGNCNNGSGAVRPLANFCANKRRKIGLSDWCRECNRKYREEYNTRDD